MAAHPHSAYRLVCILVPSVLFVVSFLLPALGEPRKSEEVPEPVQYYYLQASLTGWQANVATLELFWKTLFRQPFSPAWEFLAGWLPNPLFLAALLLLATHRPWPAAAVSLAGLVLTLLWPFVFLPKADFRQGYWCWALSLALLALLSFAHAVQSRAPFWRR
jgi:hypothetical protein